MSAPFENARRQTAESQGNAIANPEAERAVIAALTRDPDGKTIIRLDITTALFNQSATRECFVAIAALIVDGIEPDAATLRNALSDAALIEWETSLREHASAANLPVYVKLLKDCHRERTVQAATDRLVKAASAGAPDHELQAIVESVRMARQGEDEPQPPRFLWAEEFCQNSALEDDLIDGYFPAGSVGVIFGDSQAYKSFLLIDIAGHIATGKPWRGKSVQQGKVLFIAGEGGNGLRVRVKAWFERHGEPVRNFAISIVPLELCDPKNADLLISDIRRFIGNDSFCLIVLDTLNTHFGPGDENTTADMSRFRGAALRLSQATKATVGISHHCGLQDKARGRGSISLHNGIDWEFKLERGGDYTTLSNTKVKDGETPPPLSWKLVQQPLPWADKRGRPINGAVLDPADTRSDENPKSQWLTASQRIALDALKSALMKWGIEVAGVVSVAEDQWRQASYSAGISAGGNGSRAQRMAFQRARTDLVATEKVSTQDGRYWIPAGGTKRNKTEQCSGLYPGKAGEEAEQSGTHPFRGVPHVPPTAAGTAYVETKPDRGEFC